MSLELCRLCLAEFNLRPIFVDLVKHERFTLVLALTTGLKIKLNDGLPQLICTKCTSAVNATLNLRNQSQQSEITLITSGYKRKEENNIVIPKNEVKTETETDYFKNNADDCVDFDGFNVTIELNRLTEQHQNGGEMKWNDNIEPEIVLKEDPDQGNEEQIQSDNENDSENNIKVVKKPQKPKINLVKQRTKMYMDLVEGKLNKNGPVKCKVCKKTVSKWTCFINHAKIHLGFKFVCEFCGKGFISSTHLNRHCRSFHGKERDIKCKYCSYLALDNAQLLNHERLKDTGERPYVCDVCSSSYSSRKCLIQHIEGHSTSAKVMCDVCNNPFKSRRHLAKHKYSAHTGGRRKKTQDNTLLS